MILTNNKYLKNFNKHRVSFFLANKVKFNETFFFKSFLTKKNIDFNLNQKFVHDIFHTQTKINKNFNSPLKNTFEDTINFLKSLNKDKFIDFKNSISLVNKKNHFFWLKILSKFFRYSYFFRFIFEFTFFIFLLIFLFKTGTLF